MAANTSRPTSFTVPRVPRIPGYVLDAIEPWIAYVTAIGILFLSFVGTVVVFEGAWTFPVSMEALIKGVAVQGACTATEWIYRRRTRHIAFQIALGVDIYFTLTGFAPLLYPVVSSTLMKFGLSGYGLIVDTWLILFELALLVSAVPERNLIDRS